MRIDAEIESWDSTLKEVWCLQNLKLRAVCRKRFATAKRIKVVEYDMMISYLCFFFSLL